MIHRPAVVREVLVLEEGLDVIVPGGDAQGAIITDVQEEPRSITRREPMSKKYSYSYVEISGLPKQIVVIAHAWLLITVTGPYWTSTTRQGYLAFSGACNVTGLSITFYVESWAVRPSGVVTIKLTVQAIRKLAKDRDVPSTVHKQATWQEPPLGSGLPRHCGGANDTHASIIYSEYYYGG